MLSKYTAWKSFDSVLCLGARAAFNSLQFFNQYRPNPSFTPKWSDKPLLKSWEKSKLSRFFPTFVSKKFEFSNLFYSILGPFLSDENQEKNLIRDLRQQSTSPDFTDSKAGEYLNDFITVEEKKASLRKQLIVSLKNIIPNKKILTLIKAEADFHKRLVQQLRERRRGN